ncbi:MAG: hypothetical protein ISS65_14210 [Desulfobacterales bacterium]|uniref:Uncharacterized protein n=1 Tax=Candidatus Desulfatibia profunda TaxID=2841695 RepID=A0A8J6NZY0_9BACT|nr:hypothetical protein [Candidatus Desulfatibia profunda]MBL7181340.1 hypothetical protein [Desulfobacterales bacterium]
MKPLSIPIVCKNMYTKDKKIKALLTGQACKIMENALGDKATTNSYKDFFDVKRNEIDEYIERNGVPTGSYKKLTSMKDGYYLIFENGLWGVYYQERNIVFSKKEFKKEKEAVDYLVTLLLNASGTGLEF